MTALSCDEVRERAAELALDVLPGDERAEVLEHLESCPACQALVDDLAARADRLLLALPPAEPPPGFAERVLAAIDATDPTEVPARRRHRRLAMAVAAVTVVAATGVGLFVESQRLAPPGVEIVAEAPLVSPAGADLGRVSVSGPDPAWLSMRIERGSGTHTYSCVLDLDDGTTVVIGSLWISDGLGEWGRTLPFEVARLRVARVLDDDGATVASATLN